MAMFAFLLLFYVLRLVFASFSIDIHLELRRYAIVICFCSFGWRERTQFVLAFLCLPSHQAGHRENVNGAKEETTL